MVKVTVHRLQYGLVDVGVKYIQGMHIPRKRITVISGKYRLSQQSPKFFICGVRGEDGSLFEIQKHKISIKIHPISQSPDLNSTEHPRGGVHRR